MVEEEREEEVMVAAVSEHVSEVVVKEAVVKAWTPRVKTYSCGRLILRLRTEDPEYHGVYMHMHMDMYSKVCVNH